MFPIGSLLTLKERGGRLVLSPSAAFRILFAVLAALSLFTLLSGVLFDGDPTVFTGRNAVPILLVLVTVAALLYDERWIFDARAATLESRFGLLFLSKRRAVPLSGITEIRLIGFTKGKPGAAALPRDGPLASGAGRHATGFGAWLERRVMPGMARLTAVDTEGELIVIDTAKAGRIERLGRTGRRIAQYCGLPFTESSG
jgi:hypothetical protein